MILLSILIKNAGMIIQDINNILKDHDILIKNNKIEKIDRDLKEEIHNDCDVIDAANKVVIPGFVNSHTHLYQSMLRGMKDDLALKEWCEEVTFPFAGLVHKEHREKGDISSGYYWTVLGTLEMIHSGITSCINMDITLDSIFEAWEDIGMRGIGAIQTVNRWVPKELSIPDEKRKKEINEFLSKWHQDPEEGGLIQIYMAPSTPFACTDDFLKWVFNKAKSAGVGVQIHVSETSWEVEQAKKDFGTTPLKHLDNLNLLGDKLSAVHCIYLTEEEMDLAAAKNVTPIYCPKSNMKLGSGIAPVVEMLKRGMPVSLATDGPASNDLQNMFEEMRTGAMLQKVTNRDAKVLTAKDIFKMATENGAQTAGINAGVIKEGKLADVVILDMQKLHSAPIHDIFQNLVYNGKSSNVETTIINGKIVMEDYNIKTINEPKVVKKAIEVGENKCSKVNFSHALTAEF